MTKEANSIEIKLIKVVGKLDVLVQVLLEQLLRNQIWC